MNSAVTEVTTQSIAPELSLIGLFFHADWVVKIIMLGLFALSIWCWAVIFEKIRLLRNLNDRADRFEELFWSGISLNELYQKLSKTARDPITLIFTAAMNEYMRGGENLNMRLDRAMRATYGRQVAFLERNISVLGTTASVAPFIGLLGTVWGIMNSFTAIAGSQNTNLAVVAPGIAEALFATAIGLFAAIPATVAYNKISQDVDKHCNRLETFMEEFTIIIDRNAGNK